MTQSERQQRSRREIYEAALAEFGAHDYAEVSMESICGTHGISKGMMYHYYTGKDELFLLCVERLFIELRDYLQQHFTGDPADGVREFVQAFFDCRERFFAEHAGRRTLFENAVIRPPKHLQEPISQLRAPIREYNHAFLERLFPHLTLRENVSREDAARYFECVESLYWPLLQRFGPQARSTDSAAKKVLDIMLFGIARQDHQEFL
ncbi:TetR/AcrR family transcriptional regulator [Feifania hominis]|uniref:TetR/AcrR family transcriptional regulator n=1 Tax=Feifania hominis TaxID=2763660 RepID=A0A926DHJ3_9FIRM|nr:TetR/AcrR family transcriptional regulator [Feifania hominis]MBC8537180.1 TetR/AcrR family transcriptional regulator [Feifania hominis]